MLLTTEQIQIVLEQLITAMNSIDRIKQNIPSGLKQIQVPSKLSILIVGKTIIKEKETIGIGMSEENITFGNRENLDILLQYEQNAQVYNGKH